MTLSNYLAEVWGISLIIIPFAMLLNEDYMKIISEEVENKRNLLIWGMVSFVIGVAMIAGHNIWPVSWLVIVTILGWIALLKGLLILFFPVKIKEWSKMAINSGWMPIAMTILVFVGLILTYLGITA